MRARVHACGLEVGGVSPGAESSQGKGPGTGAKELAVISPLHRLNSTAVAFPGWQEIPQGHSDAGNGRGSLLIKLKPGWSDLSMPSPQ